MGLCNFVGGGGGGRWLVRSGQRGSAGRAGSARLGRDPAAGGRRHRISDKHFAVPDGTLLEPRAANEEQMSAKRRTIARVNDVCVASW